jgi:hypothetical protein
MAAFWGRPEAYLDARVRAATSPWHQLPPAAVTRALDRLRRDLAHGWWDRRYGHLRQQAELDVGLRLVSLEASATRMARRAILEVLFYNLRAVTFRQTPPTTDIVRASQRHHDHPLDYVQARSCIRADRAAAFAFFGAMEGTVIQVAGQAPHDELLPARAVAGALGLGPDVVPRCD